MATRPLDDLTDDESRPLLLATDDASPRTLVRDEGVEGRKCLKNLIVHCLCVMAAWTSFVSLDNLERDSGTKSHLEIVAISCMLAATLSVCLLAPVVIRYVGYKRTMLITFGAQCIYGVAHYYPSVYTFVPACILLGLTLGPFWTAQGMFLTTLAVNYGRHADIDADIAISRFNGLFYAFFRSSRIWASLVSSDLVAAPEDVVWNVSYPVNETCGASFCRFPISSANPLIRAPKESEVTILLSVYVGLSLMAIVVKVFFVDDVKPLVADDQHQLTLTETLTSTLNIHCHGCFGLLIPIIYYNGVEQVLILDQFTQAFVTCELGVGYLGYVMITFAAVCTVSSFMMGQLEKCCGRMLLFLTAAIFDLALLILMLKWTPGAGTKDDWLLYFIPGLWAVSDSIWQTTLVSLIAVDFRYNREEAFAAMRFWQIVGITSAFVYGLYVCMRIKLYVALVLLCTSMPLYLVMELYMKHKMNRPYIDLYAPIIE